MSILFRKNPICVTSLALAFIASCEAAAQFRQNPSLDPTKEISHYSREFWRKQEGLPQNSVNAIAQTPDGYLWLGTEEGLVRFDGVNFTVFNRRNTPELKNNHINALLVSGAGALWIGTNGGGLTIMRCGVFLNDSSFVRVDEIVRALFEDDRGKIWIGLIGRGVISFDGAEIKHYTTAQGLVDDNVTSLGQDSGGNLCVGTLRGLSLQSGERFVAHPHFKDWKFGLRGVVTDDDGNLWIGAVGGGLFRLKGNELRRFTRMDGLTSDDMRCLYRDRRGTLWLGTTGGGLNRWSQRRFTSFTTHEGLSNDNVESIFEDHEGNLWIGTNGGGLNRLSTAKFTTYPTGESVNQNMVWSLYEDSAGRLWAGNDAGELLLWQGGRFTLYSLPPSPPPGRLTSIREDSSGALWLGSSNLLRRLKKGWLTIFPEIRDILGIEVDHDGRVWVGTRNGLYCSQGKRFTRYTMNEGLSQNLIKALHGDREGTLWIGTFGGGLNRWQNGKITAVEMQDASASKILGPIYEDAEGTLWIGSSGGGLSRMKHGRLTVYTTADGLFDDNVFAMLEDNHGRLWMSCNNGVFCANKQELTDFAEGRIGTISCTSLGEADGMVSSECNGGTQSAGAKTRNGKLWFPTTMGVCMIDPAAMPANLVPPPVVVEKLVVDGRDQAFLFSETRPKIAPGYRSLEVHYAALSFAAPQRVHFRYILEGFDQDWIDAETRRVAYYTNLPPGDYRFRVIACNNDGVWNEEGASLELSLLPRFYQTRGFHLLIASMAFLIMLGAFMLYRRHQHRKLLSSQLEARLAEAQLQVLKMQLQPHFLFNTLHAISSLMHKDVEAADEMITRLGELLRLTLASDGVQEVPLNQELEFLQHYLDLEQIRLGNRLKIEMRIDPETCEAQVPNLILQPLVENAIRHGIAQRIEGGRIEIRSERRNGMLRLEVRDEGPGLPETLKEGIGLSNTRTRLQQLYGDDFHFSLASQPDEGTRIALEIPFRSATTSDWK